MKDKKTISVWLKLEDGQNAGKFILQKRSEDNKNFHYICQAAWAGEIEDKESAEDAIKRECREELGNNFADNFDFLELELISIESFLLNGENWESHNFFGRIKDNLLKTVKLHSEAKPEFIFIGKNDEVYSLESGKDPKINIVLFGDQYKTLKKILNGN